MFLSIDIGSTNSKAGILSRQGNLLALDRAPTPVNRRMGETVIDPEQLWQTIGGLIRHVIGNAGSDRVDAVSITGMAESGLFLNPVDGTARTPIIPWFNASSQPHADQIGQMIDPDERFRFTGLHLSFKLGAAKWLWLKSLSPDVEQNSIWLSALSYIAYRLTGVISEEYSMAARTYAFRIDRESWDVPFMQELGLPLSILPSVHPAVECAGRAGAAGVTLGIAEGTMVFVAGHDHLCASLAAGGLNPALAFNSMGTAEVLVGSFPRRRLTADDHKSGLSFGLHLAPDTYYWMGGNSSSGGAVEWLRSIIGGDSKMDYAELLQLLSGKKDQPTGIVFLPYLAGRGAPRPNAKAKAAFIGLTAAHGRGDMLRAVLEGNAYQMELIREAAEQVTGFGISRLVAAGGGIRNPYWLQIKADVSGVELIVPDLEEAALQGAALIAATGCGLYKSLEKCAAAWNDYKARTVQFSRENHTAYRNVYWEFKSLT